MNRKIRQEIFRRLKKENPDPRTELKYESAFQLLVAVMLSAQATDVSVNAATPKLFQAAPTPEKMIELGIDAIKDYIRTIGLFNTKAENLLKTCHILLEQHNGEVPKFREELERLPGVGRKTANVVLNTAFGMPTIAVDTHIFRVCNRTKIAKGKNPREVEDRLVRLVPTEYQLGAHHWLILHGRYVCTARSPRCASCPIEDLCEFKQKNLD
ncbi:MAG: endonuclease III [Gammaproteobacteria bacterium]|nr:endonuclease III [Gammaproteobacteria bacterium]